ncbi:hypothetical protein HDV05_005717 [Chytridiales sp. JEL 0842]|nr:hypothetical protein HDV05_005717 [Chytridiales sp. JEL 0842]
MIAPQRLLTFRSTTQVAYRAHHRSFTSPSSSASTSSTPPKEDASSSTPKPPKPRVVLSGIQPTGTPHLGNYLGALQNWVQLQDSLLPSSSSTTNSSSSNSKSKNTVLYSIVDLHALTVPQTPSLLRKNTLDMAIALLACGIDPERSILFRQSKVLQHSELAWLFFCRTPVGWVGRMHQWKTKLQALQPIPPSSGAASSNGSSKPPTTAASATIQLMQTLGTSPETLNTNSNSEGSMETNEDQGKEGVEEQFDDESTAGLCLGLLAYPVLQAADILVYRATEVPIGQDQLQHMNLTTQLARSFNSHYKTRLFPIPSGVFASESAKKIMSLKNPSAKMSKSDPSEGSRILVDDSPEAIRSKIRRAVTDSGPIEGGITYDPVGRPGVANLLRIYAALSPPDANTGEPYTPIQAAAALHNLTNKQLKETIAERVIESLKPIRENMQRLQREVGYVERVLQRGEERARERAEETMRGHITLKTTMSTIFETRSAAHTFDSPQVSVLGKSLHTTHSNSSYDPAQPTAQLKVTDANSNNTDQEHKNDEELLDLFVVGAGPSSLSLLCHILENSPFALMTEDSHQRLHYLNKKKPSSHSKARGPLWDCCGVLDVEGVKRRIKVVDSTGEWMGKWKKSFDAYQIEHLRSPMYHPESLRIFARESGRECELQDITQCFESNCKIHGRGKRSLGRAHFTPNDRRQFYTPSTSLFTDFCTHLLDRYFLHDLLHQGNVTSILPILSPTSKSPTKFIVKTISNDGTQQEFHTRRVVLALGNTNIPNIPPWARAVPKDSFPSQRLVHALDFVDCLKEGGEHAGCKKDIVPEDLAPLLEAGKVEKPAACAGILKKNAVDASMKCTVSDEVPPVRILVVGGGLTSAQLVDLAVKRGCKDVHLIMRGKLKIKQFDLDLDWVGRNSNVQFAKFWAEKKAEARLSILRKAKNGGSLTPIYATLLQSYAESKTLHLRPHTTVSQSTWIPHSENPLKRPCWAVSMSHVIQGRLEEMEYFDLIWLGTGSVVDIEREKCLENVRRMFPVEVVGGLPVLTHDLQWPGLEMYLLSAYASLSLGPTAGNLIGGRIGGQRIASVLWKKWIKETEEFQDAVAGVDDGEDDDEDEEERRGGGRPDLRTLASMTGSFGNYWESLTEEN